jgi:predicted N-acetyltransferase YhbS
LGEPEYYTKFGFEPASKKHIYYKSAQFAPYLLLIELTSGALDGISGEVFYHPFFDVV